MAFEKLTTKSTETPKPELKKAEPTIDPKTKSPETLPKWATEELISKIRNNDDLKDPITTNLAEKFMYAVKSWNINEIAKIAFEFIQNSLWSSDWKDSGFWFQDNKEIRDFAKRISENGSGMTIEQLQTQVEKLNGAIKSEEWVKKKIWFVYSLSRVLDQMVYKDKSKEWLRWDSEKNDKTKNNNTANKLCIARMAQQLKIGDILAVNKSEEWKWIWDKLLDWIAWNDLNTGHILIVTAVDSDSWKITVAQSTQNKVNWWWAGVEIDVDLSDYTDKFDAMTIAAMRPDQNIATQLVKNVLLKEWSKYSNKAAAAWTILWQDIFSKKDEYNCVTLIAKSFPPEVSERRKKRTNPSQILENMEPVYVTVAGNKAWGS